jgi:hypothetical protein
VTESTNRDREGKGQEPDDVFAATYYWLGAEALSTPENLVVDSLRRARERGCTCRVRFVITLSIGQCIAQHRDGCALLRRERS